MREIVKPGIILFIITFVAAALLGSVNYITKPLIEENRVKSHNANMLKVLPTVTNENFSEDFKTDNDTGVIAYNIGYDGDEICGYVMSVAKKGYGGKMDVVVGVNAYGNIMGVKLGSNNETPGLGKNAGNDSFTNQFITRSSSQTVVKILSGKNDEIEAITAATITSKVVTEAVNEALEFFNDNILDNGGGQK